MAMSTSHKDEALGGKKKIKAPMAHSAPGTTSTNICETLGGATKKRAPMAHVGHASTSHKDEALGGYPKKKPSMVPMSGNSSAGDAEGDI